MQRVLVRITKVGNRHYRDLEGHLAIRYQGTRIMEHVLRLSPEARRVVGRISSASSIYIHIEVLGVEYEDIRETTFDDFKENVVVEGHRLNPRHEQEFLTGRDPRD